MQHLDMNNIYYMLDIAHVRAGKIIINDFIYRSLGGLTMMGSEILCEYCGEEVDGEHAWEGLTWHFDTPESVVFYERVDGICTDCKHFNMVIEENLRKY